MLDKDFIEKGIKYFFPGNENLIIKYHDFLVTQGISKGLLGPREADKVWDRHIFNSAAVAQLIPDGASIVDIGSGAGLPGIPLALSVPGSTVHLVESLQRRCDFLRECKEFIPNIEVHRGRAENQHIIDSINKVDIVTARAVADLTKLATMALPYLKPQGKLLAIKGRKAEFEIKDHKDRLQTLGFLDPEVKLCGQAILSVATTVVQCSLTS